MHTTCMQSICRCAIARVATCRLTSLASYSQLFGRSSRHAITFTCAESVETYYASALQQLRDASPTLEAMPFHIAGHSLGGYLAGTYALAHPTHVSHLLMLGKLRNAALYYCDLRAENSGRQTRGDCQRSPCVPTARRPSHLRCVR